MAIVDRHGLPLAVTTHAANHYEVTVVQLTFDIYMIEARPANPIGDVPSASPSCAIEKVPYLQFPRLIRG